MTEVWKINQSHHAKEVLKRSAAALKPPYWLLKKSALFSNLLLNIMEIKIDYYKPIYCDFHSEEIGFHCLQLRLYFQPAFHLIAISLKADPKTPLS